jgi:hypothetical protein
LCRAETRPAGYNAILRIRNVTGPKNQGAAIPYLRIYKLKRRLSFKGHSLALLALEQLKGAV